MGHRIRSLIVIAAQIAVITQHKSVFKMIDAVEIFSFFGFQGMVPFNREANRV